MDMAASLRRNIAMLEEMERMSAELVADLLGRGWPEADTAKMVRSHEREQRLSAKLREQFERKLARLEAEAARAAMVAFAKAPCGATRH